MSWYLSRLKKAGHSPLSTLSKYSPQKQKDARFFLNSIQVGEKGEAEGFPELRQEGLHVVTVGPPGQKKNRAADDLLRELITMPRPVLVEFAKKNESSPPKVGKASPGTRELSVKRQSPGCRLERKGLLFCGCR